jgi:serine/threonine protein kinase
VNELQAGDPETIGPYRLHARIGAGGMGVVYLASDASGREVALKLVREELAADPAFRARFAREVRAGQRVGGMCTAHFLDAELESPRPYLVSEYVAGGNLADYVATHGPLESDRLMGLAVGLAEGLVAMGAAGVIHRDLKPTNVLMGERGPKIVDFGISVAADGTSLTQTGAVVGSPSWMAPEQAQGRATTGAVDVFSWGATVAFAATGRQPFGEGRPDAVIYRVVHEEPDLAGIDTRLAPLVRSALAKEPSLRPAADALLVNVVRSAAPGALVDSGPSAEAEATDVIERTWAMPRRRIPKVTGRQIAAGVAALVLIAAFIAGALYVAHGKNSPSQAASNVKSASHHGATRAASTTTTASAPVSSQTTGAGASPTADVTASLAVVSCPTSMALDQPPPPKNLPPTLPISVPSDLVSQLSVYADEQGIMDVVAPKGWDCTASFGADGSGGVTVVPSGEVLPQSNALPTGSQAEAIVATQNGGCQGCAASQACPFFADANQADPGSCINTSPPAEEQTTQLASNIVGFEDPPNFAGNANPSGGEYPANAVVTFTHDPAGSSGNYWSSWLETCTLPYSQQALCTAVLNDFASRYRDS